MRLLRRFNYGRAWAVGGPLHKLLLAADVRLQALEALRAHLCAHGVDGNLRNSVQRTLRPGRQRLTQRGREIGEHLD
jgi:hypothetical protein